LRRLENIGLVEEENGIWFPPGDPPEGDPRLHGAGPSGKELFEALDRRGPMTCSEAAETLDLSRSAVSQLVSRLEDAELLETRRQGRHKLLSAKLP
jgi:DNA-binding transcriptional ArsR family regulator